MVYMLYEPSIMITKNHIEQIVKGFLYDMTIVAGDSWLIHLASCLRAHPPPTIPVLIPSPFTRVMALVAGGLCCLSSGDRVVLLCPGMQKAGCLSCRICGPGRVVKCVEKKQTFTSSLEHCKQKGRIVQLKLSYAYIHILYIHDMSISRLKSQKLRALKASNSPLLFILKQTILMRVGGPPRS